MERDSDRNLSPRVEGEGSDQLADGDAELVTAEAAGAVAVEHLAVYVA